jgi:hypothetical protein
MLERDELLDTAAAFGVTEEQVVRDHLISHVLFAIAARTSTCTAPHGG